MVLLSHLPHISDFKVYRLKEHAVVYDYLPMRITIFFVCVYVQVSGEIMLFFFLMA